MKRYMIVHRTTYLYSGPVRLGPHTLRLRPREGHDLRIESSSLSLLPMGRLRWHRDVEDNCLVRATFDGVSDQLQIDSRLVILQYDHEPLDFFVDDYAVDYPFSYAPSDWPVLDAYRLSVPVDQISPLAQWTRGLWRPGEAIQSYALLKRLNLAIHQLISYRKREEPGVQTPAETLAMVSGSCRDMAFLFIEAARLLGFAARFVSGYSFTSLLRRPPAAPMPGRKCSSRGLAGRDSIPPTETSSVIPTSPSPWAVRLSPFHRSPARSAEPRCSRWMRASG